MGPNGDADVASNIFEAVESGPVECHAATLPDDGSPLLHVDVPHHPLSHPAVRSAIAFAQAQQYHTVHSNWCAWRLVTRIGLSQENIQHCFFCMEMALAFPVGITSKCICDNAC